MSFFKSIGNAVSSVFRNPIVNTIGSVLPQTRAVFAVGNALGLGGNAAQAAQTAMVMPPPPSAILPSRMTAFPGIGSMSLLPTIARGAGAAVRRYGGAAVGAATAGAILYDAMGNPVRKPRRRSKGITARELKSFTRVTAVLNKYCKTPSPTKRRGASRGKACR